MLRPRLLIQLPERQKVALCSLSGQWHATGVFLIYCRPRSALVGKGVQCMYGKVSKSSRSSTSLPETNVQTFININPTTRPHPSYHAILLCFLSSLWPLGPCPSSLFILPPPSHIPYPSTHTHKHTHTHTHISFFHVSDQAHAQDAPCWSWLICTPGLDECETGESHWTKEGPSLVVLVL